MDTKVRLSSNSSVSRGLWKRLLGISVGAAMAASALSASPAQAAEADLVPLVTFYSAERGDYFTTSQPEWTCKALGTCAADPGYRVVGIQGHVYRPDRPQPAGTRPLYHWFSPSRGDNFLTTDPSWAGAVGDTTLGHDGYRLFRIEGYIPSAAVAGSVPLSSYWNPTQRDNAALNPRRASLPAGYSLYRLEGYLLGPDTPAGNLCETDVRPNHTDAPWTARGNYQDPWIQGNLLNRDGFRITASGYTTTDHWGARKGVNGDSEAAGSTWPAPGENKYMLIGRVTSGRVWVPGKGWYEANQWFPVGASTSCLEYHNNTNSREGELVMSINDDNLGDNRDGPSVVVRHWWR